MTKTCFMAMPITTHADQVQRYGGDAQHWQHVMETLFEPALRAAGFDPIRPATVGAHMIHGEIIRNLSEADLVLVDLSSHNPNVFFELGVRTSLNRPVALVADEDTTLPFDTAGINTHKYNSALRGWEIANQVTALSEHLTASWTSCYDENPLWRHFGLVLKASEPSSEGDPTAAKIDLLAEGMARLEREVSIRQVELQAENERLRGVQLGMSEFPITERERREVQARLRADAQDCCGEVYCDVGVQGRHALVVFDTSGLSGIETSRLKRRLFDKLGTAGPPHGLKVHVEGRQMQPAEEPFVDLAEYQAAERAEQRRLLDQELAAAPAQDRPV